MDRDEVEVNKNAIKERGQYPAILTEQAWSIKDLLYGQKVTPSISFNAPANVYPRDFEKQPLVVNLFSYISPCWTLVIISEMLTSRLRAIFVCGTKAGNPERAR